MAIKDFFVKLVNWEGVREKDKITAQRYMDMQKTEKELALERAKENQRRAGEDLIEKRQEAEEEKDLTKDINNL